MRTMDQLLPSNITTIFTTIFTTISTHSKTMSITSHDKTPISVSITSITSKLNLEPLIFVVHGGWADYSVDF
jgi:hypothetical protein